MSENLFDAIAEGDYNVVETLLKGGVSANLTTTCGLSALYFAVLGNFYAITELLLKYGANPNIGAIFPLETAVELNRPDLVKLLLLNKANPNIMDAGSTPLHLSSFNDFIDIMKLLLDAGAFTNIQDYEGNTPLHYAVYRNNYKGVKILIEKGADPTINSNRGKSPLDYAKFYGLKNIIELFNSM